MRHNVVSFITNQVELGNNTVPHYSTVSLRAAYQQQVLHPQFLPELRQQSLQAHVELVVHAGCELWQDGLLAGAWAVLPPQLLHLPPSLAVHLYRITSLEMMLQS